MFERHYTLFALSWFPFDFNACSLLFIAKFSYIMARTS